MTTRQSFDRNISNWARDLTTQEFTGTKSWVVSVHLKGVADNYDISNLTSEFLLNELKLCKSHFYLDGHNWSDFHRATTSNMIEIIERLIVRKVGA